MAVVVFGGFGTLSSLTRDRPPTAIELGGTKSKRSFGVGECGSFIVGTFGSGCNGISLDIHLCIKPRLFFFASNELSFRFALTVVLEPFTLEVVFVSTFVGAASGFAFDSNMDFLPRIDFSLFFCPLSSFFLLFT